MVNKSGQAGASFTSPIIEIIADCFSEAHDHCLVKDATFLQVNIDVERGPELSQLKVLIADKIVGNSRQNLDTEFPKQEGNYQILDYLGGVISF